MIVGTAGHVDHGKTALVRALTGVDTDRLPEEKARGITIDLGFAYLPGPAGNVIGFVDVPGHERFVGTMAAGAAGIDFLMLVVAADDGIMPQTREHLAIADLLGLRRGLVAMTKADLASPERRAVVEAQIRAVLGGTALARAPIVATSTVSGEGLDHIRRAIEDAGAEENLLRRDGRFRLTVDRGFSLPGAGTIVTGTVLSGSVAVGDDLSVAPRGIPARVRSIHAQNHPAEIGRTGQRCALNLAGIARTDVARGDVVLDPSLLAPTDRIDVLLRILPSEPKPAGTWLPVRFHCGAAEVAARLVPLAADAIGPGAQSFAQLVLERPVAVAAGDRFVLRDTSAQRTIGGGVLLDLRAPARKRRTPERLARLEAMRESEPERAVSALLDVPPFCLDLTGFCRDRALAEDAPETLASRLDLATLRVGHAVSALSRARWAGFMRSLTEELAGFHAENPDLQGIGIERLRLALQPRLERPVFDAVLVSLRHSGQVAVEGSWARLPGHVVRLSEADEAVWAQIAPMLCDPAERFRPPRVRDLAGRLGAAEPDLRRLLKMVGRLGRVDEVAHDHFFPRSTVCEMAGILRMLSASAPGRGFTAAQFRDEVGTGRKLAIQILEFFDRHGVTMRRGDLRRANPHRVDVFAAAGPEGLVMGTE